METNYIVTLAWMADLVTNESRGSHPFSVMAKDEFTATHIAFKNAETAMAIPLGATISVKSIIKG